MPRYLKLLAPDGSPVLLNADAIRRVQRATGGCNIDDSFYKNSYEEVQDFLLPPEVSAAKGHEDIRHATKGHSER